MPSIRTTKAHSRTRAAQFGLRQIFSVRDRVKLQPHVPTIVPWLSSPVIWLPNCESRVNCNAEQEVVEVTEEMPIALSQGKARQATSYVSGGVSTDRFERLEPGGVWKPVFLCMIGLNGLLYVRQGQSHWHANIRYALLQPCLEELLIPARRQNAGCAVFNGKIYVSGKQVCEIGSRRVSRLVACSEVFDPVTASWTSFPSEHTSHVPSARNRELSVCAPRE